MMYSGTWFRYILKKDSFSLREKGMKRGYELRRAVC